MTAVAHPVVHGDPRPRAAPPELSFRVARGFDELQSFCEQWDAFVQSVGGDLYFSYDWCQAWWQHYGQGESLHIVLAFRAERLVAVLPLMVERVLVGFLPVRVARLVGAHSTISVLCPPIADDSATQVVRWLLNFTLNFLRCDVLSLPSLSAASSLPALVRAECSIPPRPARLVRDRSAGIYTEFDLPRTFDLYLASLNKSARGNYRRDERQLAESFSTCHHTATSPDELAAAFDDFHRLHTSYWRARRRLGHFDDWPQSRAFTADLLRRLAVRGAAEIERLTSNERLIASELVFRFGRTLHWRLPARRPDPELEKLGIGRVMLVRLIRRAIETGATRLEAGPGHYEYKQRLGGRQLPLTNILVARNTWTSTAKAKLLCLLADALELLYYRVWFSRIAPRLPLRRRPLWRVWIRTRI